jgi:hypothetical protein
MFVVRVAPMNSNKVTGIDHVQRLLDITEALNVMLDEIQLVNLLKAFSISSEVFCFSKNILAFMQIQLGTMCYSH